jgi:hypothetical protein
MNASSEIRKQVLERIIEVLRDAEDQGGISAAAAAFPGTPETVLWEAWCELDYRRTQAWWQAVEKTIDGELVRRAIAEAGNKGGGEP